VGCVVAISANAVLKEEAFYSPLALGFAMLLIGTIFGTYFRNHASGTSPVSASISRSG
jgi:hypothetical protein